MKKCIHVLNRRGNLARDKEGNPGVLQQPFRHGKLDAVVCFKHYNEIDSGFHK